MVTVAPPGCSPRPTRTGGTGDLVAFAIDDDGMLLWLTDRSNAAESFAKSFPQSYTGVGNDINKQPKPFTSSGADAAAFIGVPFSDARSKSPRTAPSTPARRRRSPSRAATARRLSRSHQVAARK